MDRRTFVKVGLGGAALLALSGVGLSLLPSKARAPGKALQVLSPQSFSVLAAIADRLCPANGLFPAASELEVAESIDLLLTRCHPAVAAELAQVLQLFENGLANVLFDARFSTFTSADPATQDAALEAWRTSALPVRRTAFKALHGLVAGAYYGHPRAWPALGYAGPPNFGNGAGEVTP
jgi:hypothetical protein